MKKRKSALEQKMEMWLQNNQLGKRVEELEAELAEARKDNEELDGTDAAHPAWRRGYDAAVAQICQRVNNILDGMPVDGKCSDPWESTRRRVAEARKDSERLEWLEKTNDATSEEIAEMLNGFTWRGKYRGSLRAAIDAARGGK